MGLFDIKVELRDMYHKTSLGHLNGVYILHNYC